MKGKLAAQDFIMGSIGWCLYYAWCRVKSTYCYGDECHGYSECHSAPDLRVVSSKGLSNILMLMTFLNVDCQEPVDKCSTKNSAVNSGLYP